MAGNGRQDNVEKLNMVQKDALFVEHVKKMQRIETLPTKFTISPRKKIHVLPEKPMSRKPPEDITTDTEYIDSIHRARLEPTKKYSTPQTESQEIGWYTAPLIPPKWNDRRLNFHRRRTNITRLQESALPSTKKADKEKNAS